MNTLARPAVDSWLALSCQTTNRAGSALPSIPRRRSSSSRHVYTLSDSTASSSTSTLTNTQQLSPQQRSPPIPKITPITLPATLIEDVQKLPSDLKISVSGPASAPTTPAPVSEYVVPFAVAVEQQLPPRSTSVPPSEAPSTSTISIPVRVLRKKSGEPIKSSLKSPRRPAAEGLSLLTIAPSFSMSAPATPSGKSVHFDSQLEHVKLFLAEQKPAAVSRSGSPNEYTDETGDSDFPSFIYGPPKRATRKLVISGDTSATVQDGDVFLLSMELADESTSLLGRVQVRNLSFEKWIAIRFTFDNWQTTSEVTAKYLLSKNEGASDVFSFTIRLNDLMSRIDSRTLLLAIRYTTDGRDIWDNNAGKNYSATFQWVEDKPVQPEPEPRVNDRGSHALKVLTSRLEAVAQTRNQTGSPKFLVAGADSGESSPVFATPSAPLGSLAGRYDFKASLRNNPWSPPAVDNARTHHGRNKSHPNSIPWPSASKSRSRPLASPRALDGEDVDSAAVKNPSGPKFESFEMSPPSTPATKSSETAGYFDLPKALDLPPQQPAKTSPRSPEMFRFNSFPPEAPSKSPVTAAPRFNDTHYLPVWASLGIKTAGSEDSTPSMTSPSTSSRSDSPEPDVSALSSPMWSPYGRGAMSPVEQQPTDYNNILERMCFYTGGNDDGIHRSHSASSVETFLASSSPPTLSTPTRRSPSFDEYYYRSGSTTPTARSSAGFPTTADSRSPTPVVR